MANFFQNQGILVLVQPQQCVPGPCNSFARRIRSTRTQRGLRHSLSYESKSTWDNRTRMRLPKEESER
jgi:hypothetical protein